MHSRHLHTQIHNAQSVRACRHKREERKPLSGGKKQMWTAWDDRSIQITGYIFILKSGHYWKYRQLPAYRAPSILLSVQATSICGVLSPLFSIAALFFIRKRNYLYLCATRNTVPHRVIEDPASL